MRLKLCLVFLALVSQLWANPETLSKTVMRVNDHNITQRQLDMTVNALISSTYYHGNISGEKRKSLEKDAKKELIKSYLFYDYARTKGIVAPKAKLHAIEKQFIAANGSMENFEKALTATGLSLERFREELLITQTLELFYAKEIKKEFTDKELRAYYDANKYKFKMPEKIRVRVIYTKVDPTLKDGRTKAEARMDEALEKIKGGDSFADVAAKYSNAMSRIKGGDLGYLHRGQLDSAFEDEAFALEIGQMSEVIARDIGFYLVYVEDKAPAEQIAFDVIKPKLKKELTQKHEKEAIESLYTTLRSQASITDLSK